MSAQALIVEFTQKHGLGGTEAKEEEGCEITFDDVHSVDIDATDTHMIRLCAKIANLPSSGHQTLFEMLLEANFLARGTEGAAIGLDRDLGEVVLCRHIDTEGLAYTAFERALEAFLDNLDYWREEVSGDSSRDSSEDLSISPVLRELLIKA